MPDPRQPVRRPAAARRAADQPGHRRRTGATCWPGSADGTVDIAIGTHALIQEGVAVPQPRRGRDRRAAPLRRRAARRAARERRRRRRARRAGHDRDADPAHGGDDGVRRPRRERARRAAAGPHADRAPTGPTARSMEQAGVGDRARRGGGRPPGVRRVPADRGVREARGCVAPRRPSSACCRRARRACGSGCCTAGCRRPRRRR